MRIDKAAVEEIARATVCFPKKRKWEPRGKDARFRPLPGASSEVVAELWNMIEEKNSNGLEGGAGAHHLLHALTFLEACSAEEAHCSATGPALLPAAFAR